MNGEMHIPSGKTAERGRPRHMNGEASPEELQHDLDRTRADLNATLHAIEERFSPGQMVDQVLGYLKGGPKEYAHNLSVQVKENPLPVALIGIGIAWLSMGPRVTKERAEYTSEGIAETAGERMHGMGERVSEKKAELRARMGRRVSETRERMSHAAERMRERREAAGERGSEVAGRLRERGMYARDRFSSLMEEQPLVVGALAVAVGALLGAGLPVSRREEEAMGPVSGEMMHKAKEVSREESARMAASVKEGAAGEPSPPITH